MQYVAVIKGDTIEAGARVSPGRWHPADGLQCAARGWHRWGLH